MEVCFGSMFWKYVLEVCFDAWLAIEHIYEAKRTDCLTMKSI